jgi:hypothetical protein
VQKNELRIEFLLMVKKKNKVKNKENKEKISVLMRLF